MLAHDEHDGQVDVHLQLCCRTEEAHKRLPQKHYVLMFYCVTGVCALPYR